MILNYQKVAYLTVFYLLFSQLTFSQDNWTWLNPKPMGFSIYGSAIIPASSTIIGVGAKGVIVKSTDNGTSWILLRSDNSQTLNSVSFATSSVGFAVGNAGVILKTTDAGETWTPTTTPTDAGNLTQIQFVSPSIGFVNDKSNLKIHKTTDGGATWEPFIVSSYGAINSFEMFDDSHGFCGTNNGNILKINSGILYESFTASVAINALDFFTASKGIAAGNGRIYITSDAGVTWDAPMDVGFDIMPTAVSFSDESKIVAVSSSEMIYYSPNGGYSWSALNTGGAVALQTLLFSGTTGIALGEIGVTYVSINSGGTWSKIGPVPSLGYQDLNSITSYNGVNIWAAGSNGKIIKSTDGGANWTNSSSTDITSSINDIEFVSGTRGWAVTSTVLYYTTNAGVNWFNSLSTSAGSQEVKFVSYTRGYFCGSHGLVRYCRNGFSWVVPATLPAGAYYSIGVTSDTNIAYLCGANNGKSKLIKTINAGTDWVAQTGAEFSGVVFYSVNFPTPTTGWTVGTGGSVYKTTDGGMTWDKQTSNATSTLQSVSFSDENHGIATGENGTIITTTNGGITWIRAKEFTEQTIMSALKLDESTSIVAGNYSTILKSYNAPLPVELTSFTARVSGSTVTLNWETKTEIDNYGFEIERKTTTSAWQKIGFVEGHGTANSPKYYSFNDNNPLGSKIEYRLKQIDNDGTFEYSKVAEVELAPVNYTLYQNYPNPFNPSTVIRFTIPVAGNVTLNVYNTLGEKVATLIDGAMESGYHQVSFDAANLSSGLYFYELQAGEFKSIKKMLLMK